MAGESMGYFCRGGVSTSSLLMTNESIRKVYQPLNSAGAFGADESYVANQVVYDFPRYQGNINFDVDSNGWGLVDFVFTHAFRKTKFNIDIYYSETGWYHYADCVWTDFNLSASSNGLVRGSIGVLSFDRTVTGDTMSYIDNENQVGLSLNDPIPFWDTQLSNFVDYYTTEWSLSVNNNVKELNTMQRVTIGSAPNSPTNVVPGLAEVTLNVTHWSRISPLPTSTLIAISDLGTILVSDLVPVDNGKNFDSINEPVFYTESYRSVGTYPIAA